MRLGGVFLCFGRVLKVCAWLGGGLKPGVASQMTLRHFGGGSAASWRRLEGILETSCRGFGAGLGHPGSFFLGLGRDIWFIVDFLSIFSSLND